MRVGDIVEVLLSMLLTPIKNGRFKMTPKLRGITLLDSKFTDVSIWSFCTGNVTDIHLHKGSIYQTNHDNQQETSRPKTQARLQ